MGPGTWIEAPDHWVPFLVPSASEHGHWEQESHGHRLVIEDAVERDLSYRAVRDPVDLDHVEDRAGEA